MAQSKYILVIEKSSIVDGGAMIDDLMQCILLLSNFGIVDVDETICAAGEQKRGVCRMKLNLSAC